LDEPGSPPAVDHHEPRSGRGGWARCAV